MTGQFDPPWPTPNCTPTPTSLSSTAPAIPRSWPPRRPGWVWPALALTDHDGLYGVVRFAEAARALGLPTVFGAELTSGTGVGPSARVDRSHRSTRSGRHPPGGAGP